MPIPHSIVRSPSGHDGHRASPALRRRIWHAPPVACSCPQPMPRDLAPAIPWAPATAAGGALGASPAADGALRAKTSADAGGGATGGSAREAKRSASVDGAGTPSRFPMGATEIQSAAAVAAAAAGTSHRIVRLAGHHDRRATGGSVRAMADRTAWHRAHPAAWLSAAARAVEARAPSIQAATVSASRQSAAVRRGVRAEPARQETVHRSLGYALILSPGCRLGSFVVHQILII